MSCTDDILFQQRKLIAGFLADEMPLRPNVRLVANLPLGLDFGDDPHVQSALDCLIANAVLASWHLHISWIFYSRDHNHYAAVRPLAPAWYTRRAMIAAVDWLATAGWLEGWRTAPSANGRFRSRVRATPALLAAFRGKHVADLCWTTPPSIVLRDATGQRLLNPRMALPAGQLRELSALATDVEAHNCMLSNLNVDVADAERGAGGLLAIGSRRINPLRRSYYRVFNGSLELGGRWYGPWWQDLPGSLRRRITINGETTVELDFAACQLRLLLALSGVSDPLQGEIRHHDPRCDLYRADGLERELVKLTLLIMINAPHRQSPTVALDKQLRQTAKKAGRTAQEVLARVEAGYPQLQPFWFTGIGLRLQRMDADICATVQREMRSRGLPVLSIHDSFVTFRPAQQTLRDSMREAFASKCRAIFGRGSDLGSAPRRSSKHHG